MVLSIILKGWKGLSWVVWISLLFYLNSKIWYLNIGISGLNIIRIRDVILLFLGYRKQHFNLTGILYENSQTIPPPSPLLPPLSIVYFRLNLSWCKQILYIWEIHVSMNVVFDRSKQLTGLLVLLQSTPNNLNTCT